LTPRPLTATEIAEAVAARRLTAADALAACAARHEETHVDLNALVQPRLAAAAAEARAVDAGRAGRLAGVPVSVKECFAVRGLKTTLGIPDRRDATDAADAEIVTRLRRAGAVIVGKANVPQAMFLHETDNPVWGRTNHPTAADRGPGGSSGGDAALVAAGVVPLAVGNDLAGSLRQPANACGVAALVPRFTALGGGGAFETLPGLKVVRSRAGFLSRSVADLGRAVEALGVEVGPVPGRLRIGSWDEAGPVGASAAVRRATALAVARLQAAGAEIVPLDGSLAVEAAWLHLAILGADGGADIRRLLGAARPIPGVGRLLRLAQLSGAWRRGLATLARLVGSRIESEALLRTGPRTAWEMAGLIAAREALRARFTRLVSGLDAVVCPVSALPALPHGSAARLVLAAMPCFLANLLDLAAGAVPVTEVRPDEEGQRPRSGDPVLVAAAATDRGSRGLPVGVQVIAPPRVGEAVVLAAMAVIESG
jgi:fatty acid amide hydrolase